MKTSSPYYRVKSVEKAVKILEVLSVRQEASLSELSQILRLTKTNVHRLLLTLRENGMVLGNKDGSKYTLSLKLFSLGGSVNHRAILISVAFSQMQKLSKQSRETINLGILHNDGVLYLDKIESPEYLRIDSPIGKIDPAYCTALGKCLLSGLGKEELANYMKRNMPFKPLTESTITDSRKLIAELDEVRKRGYAIDRQELMKGVSCIGSPIYDGNGRTVAAISVSGPSARLTHQKLMVLKDVVIETSKLISLQLKKTDSEEYFQEGRY